MGKSSLINSLKRSRACKVGAVPGVTRFVHSTSTVYSLQRTLYIVIDLIKFAIGLSCGRTRGDDHYRIYEHWMVILPMSATA